MSDDSDISPSRPSLADAIDLLDLVRSSEEGATLATRQARTPASPEPVPGAQEFVEVGEEALDLPPSLPPIRAAQPSMPPSMPPIPKTTRSPSTTDPPPPLAKPRPAEPTEAGMSPAASLLIFAVLAIGALYAVMSLPSCGDASSSRAKPAELELEGGAE